MSDPAETETEARRKAGFAAPWDRVTESNLALVRTVRTAITVVAAIAVLSMTWSAFTTWEMRATLAEMRVMLLQILDAVTKVERGPR